MTFPYEQRKKKKQQQISSTRSESESHRLVLLFLVAVIYHLKDYSEHEGEGVVRLEGIPMCS